MASVDKSETKMSGARRAAMKGGRFTPKGTPAPVKAAKGVASKGAKSGTEAAEAKIPAYAQSGRYTPPVHHEADLLTEGVDDDVRRLDVGFPRRQPEARARIDCRDDPTSEVEQPDHSGWR